jgi:hypothetical protein
MPRDETAGITARRPRSGVAQTTSYMNTLVRPRAVSVKQIPREDAATMVDERERA